MSPASTRPPSVCPVHPEHALELGPVQYRCPLGHSVPAADINREIPLTPRAMRVDEALAWAMEASAR